VPKSPEELDQEKQRAAEAALRLVESGMNLGLGSGSTVAKFVRLLGEQVRARALTVRCVPTSSATREIARAAGITLIEPSRGLRLDLTVDGADEITPNLALTKGGGGALLREKVVARASRRVVIIADSSKRVTALGAFPLPVEVVPFSVPWVLDAIADLGGVGAVHSDRSGLARPLATDQGNWVLDCRFGTIQDAARLEARLERIAGVVEHGLFLGIAHKALVADGTTIYEIEGVAAVRM
jgi:ribose 5-phosphate isomerase A